MYPIDLPSYDVQLKKENELTYIFDAIRKKYLVLTPEEWVRQHIIQLLINTYGYPKGLFSLEKGHTYNTLQKRSDLIIYNTEGKAIILCECKAHSEKINRKVLEQVMNYNLVIHSPIILISNGIQTFCFERQGDHFIQAKDIPFFNYK